MHMYYLYPKYCYDTVILLIRWISFHIKFTLICPNRRRQVRIQIDDRDLYQWICSSYRIVSFSWTWSWILSRCQVFLHVNEKDDEYGWHLHAEVSSLAFTSVTHQSRHQADSWCIPARIKRVYKRNNIKSKYQMIVYLQLLQIW